MIKTFADKRTPELFVTGAAKRFPPDVAARAARKLEYVELATSLHDPKVRPAIASMRSRVSDRDSTRSR